MEADHPEIHGFSLRYQDGWAVLIVPPEDRRPRPVYADDVAARMRILDIPPVPAKRLRDIIDAGSGRPERLVEWPAGASLNAVVSVAVDEDGMAAWATATAARPGGSGLDRTAVREALSRAGVTSGLDKTALRRLLDPKNAGERLPVARGRAVVPGKPSRTDCLFVTERGKPWKELAGGRVDLKELHFIQNRKAGDLLARFVDAVPPKDGYDVFGTVIPAEPIPEGRRLRAGEGVEETAEGLVAAVDGNVRLEDEEICVEPTVSVENVDYSTGNIDFDGSVSVAGTVADGFSVKATGDLQVGKTVGRCRLEAGRCLVLQAGMVGDEDGTAVVGADLYTKFLENARVRAAGNLIVTEAVLHSDVEVQGNLTLTEGRGEITGGVAMVGGHVDCKKIGNVYSGATRLSAGCPPEDLKTFHELAGRLQTSRDELDEMERRLDYMKSRRNSDARQISALERTRDARVAELKEGARSLKGMKDRLEAAFGTTVTVRDRIFPGAKISFGLDEFPLGEKGLERVVLRRIAGKTEVHGFKESGVEE